MKEAAGAGRKEFERATGIREGEGMPFEGGILFNPKTKFFNNKTARLLYDEVHEAWGDRRLSRDEFIELVNKIAQENIRNTRQRQRAVKLIIAFEDEIMMLKAGRGKIKTSNRTA